MDSKAIDDFDRLIQRIMDAGGVQQPEAAFCEKSWEETEKELAEIELNDHIETIGILEDDIGTFKRILDWKHLKPALRQKIERQIKLDRQVIFDIRQTITEFRHGKKTVDQGPVEGIPGE